MSTVQSQIERKFEIHVKEHPGELLQHINSAWKERRLCDFRIKIGSEDIHVHKIVLSEGSDYFKAMFSHKMKEVESGVAVMEDVDAECMLLCIEYIYTGKVSVPESKVQPLLRVANMLQLTKLCEVIGAFLETNLDPESFFWTQNIAKTFNLQGLKDHCEKYALENFKSIAVKEEFKDLEKEIVKSLIESKKTKASEAGKCKALVLWAKSDPKKRSEVFEEVFQNLRLVKIPIAYRHYLTANEPLVSESAKCLRKLFKSTAVVRGSTTEDFDLEVDNYGDVIAVFDKNSKSIEAFNPEDGNWKTVHNVSDDIISKTFSAVVLDETIYVLASDKTNYILDFMDSEAKWIKLNDRAETGEVIAAAFHGEVYAFHNRHKRSQAIEILDVQNASWSQMNKPVQCMYESVVATENFLYTFGGSNGRNLQNASKFDPGTKTWSDLPQMPTARYGAVAAELGGKIYVIGGYTSDYVKTTECFDLESETWETLNCMMNSRYIFNAFAINGKVYAIGGYPSRDSIEEYDASTDNWKVVHTMPDKQIHDRATVPMSI